MAPNVSWALETADRPSRCTQEVLVEQLLWLIKHRWIAVLGIVAGGVIGSVVFPVLMNPVPIYVCAGVLLLCNVLYYLVATKTGVGAGLKDLVLAMVQVELDLIILTIVLHFSGGVVNPFFLFYIFHVIIAAIILPRNLSYYSCLACWRLMNSMRGWCWDIIRLRSPPGAVCGEIPFLCLVRLWHFRVRWCWRGT